jgi:hypothetical protein
VELERLIAHGLTPQGRRNSFESPRDHAAELYDAETGLSWRPWSGFMVNHRALTAALIDSRDDLSAKRTAETQVLLTPGALTAITGGTECTDHARIWDVLDKVRAKHPSMVLLHGGSPEGAERIAACWADNRQMPQIAFKPGWPGTSRRSIQAQRHYARDDADGRLEAMPIGAVVFPGSGISQNLADKAKKLSIPLMRFDRRGQGTAVPTLPLGI